tara:strand:+ start:1150 stop:1368 length:219 start_codon:yes stop_codon:yes gene_type:complete
MKDLIQKLYLMIVELREISQANNELLGFLCMKIAPNKTSTKEINKSDIAYISMEMSEIFEKYNISPDEYGVS